MKKLTERGIKTATCRTCETVRKSQRGFQMHIDDTGHFPVPVEYTELTQRMDSPENEEAVEVVVGSKGKTF